MKIIALLPLKNESWILETYLGCMSKVADEIIILDDNSTDDSVLIARRNPKVKIFFLADYIQDGNYVDFSKRRQCLLDLGRKAGGTHFILLDADEIFSSNFIPIAKEKILSLLPGEKIFMPWVTLWKSTNEYIVGGSVWAMSYKDFIVCDSPEIFFEKRFIHEDRTPGINKKIIKIPVNQGVVLHFQFVDWNRNQLKQALYRCSELIEGTRDAKRINISYAYTLDSDEIKVMPVFKEWIYNKDSIKYYITDTTNDWRFIELLKLFNKYGIEFFEPLQVWHIKELNNEFIKRVGRSPVPKTFPFWLIQLNTIKNRIKNSLIYDRIGD